SAAESTGKAAVVSATATEGSAAPAAARKPAQPGKEDEEQQEEEQQRPEWDDHPLALVRRRRRRPLVRGEDALRDGRDAAFETFVESGGLEGREDLLILDGADETVGQDPLDPVAREDAELPVLGGEQYENAGVLAASPHLPGICHPHGVGEVVERRGGGDGEDGDLGAGPGFHTLGDARDALPCVGRQDARQVGDEALGS